MTHAAQRSTSVLVTDFDGTVTARDFYRIAMEYLAPPGTPDYWEEYLAGRMTHIEALREIFSRITADADTVMAAAKRMDLDPATPDAIRALVDAGWQVVIASAGCAWYISRLLGDVAPLVTLHANPGELIPGAGLRMALPMNSPVYSPTTGIDKEAVVRRAVDQHDIVAFAGDGQPDLPAALLVSPERRFARGWMAEEMTRRGIAFRPFARWPEIARALLEEG